MGPAIDAYQEVSHKRILPKFAENEEASAKFKAEFSKQLKCFSLFCAASRHNKYSSAMNLIMTIGRHFKGTGSSEGTFRILLWIFWAK